MTNTSTKQKSYTLILGFPNTGKTTLFNALTGERQKVVNYPGSTVDFSIATSKNQPSRTFIDSPGLSSFFSNCINEQLTLKSLNHLNNLIPVAHQTPDLLLVVVDATQCETQLAFVKQLKDHGYPIVVALTMIDQAENQGININTEALSHQLVCPVIPVSAKKAWQLDKLNLACSYQLLLNNKKPSLKPFLKNNQNYFKWSEEIAQKIYNKKPSLSRKYKLLDRIMLHPIWGGVSFISIMAAFFSSLFLLASPFIDLIDQLFAFIGTQLSNTLPQHWISACLIDGGIGGISAIFVFIPQIALLFLGLGILEGSGYLARAALIIDKPFSKLGLSGKSFVPLLSGCACAIPALMATRNINNKKERFICQWIVPLMQCSARLPVYGLLLLLLFPSNPIISGLFLTGIYLFSFILSAAIAYAISIFSKSQSNQQIFCLELPKWRIPDFKNIAADTIYKCINFVRGAGPLILGISFVLWFISVFPSEQSSFALKLGHYLDPLFSPLGLDWRCGVAILLSFAAREVFASVLAVMFASDTLSLRESLTNAVHANTGELLFNTGTILSLLIFYMIALQCGATVAVASREMGSKRMAVFQFISYFCMAYVFAFIVQKIF